jgi:protein involved in polysaccharide export with SLBB domain
MEAGGFTRGLADLRRVRIIRKVGNSHQTMVVDLTKAMSGESSEAIYVQPYDVIHVPETWL